MEFYLEAQYMKYIQKELPWLTGWCWTHNLMTRLVAARPSQLFHFFSLGSWGEQFENDYFALGGYGSHRHKKQLVGRREKLYS